MGYSDTATCSRHQRGFYVEKWENIARVGQIDQIDNDLDHLQILTCRS